MSTILLLFLSIQDPFDDLCIGAVKSSHSFSGTDTAEKLNDTYLKVFFKLTHFILNNLPLHIRSSSFEFGNANSPFKILLHYLDHEDLA